MRVLHVVGATAVQTGSFERHLLAVVEQGRKRGIETQLCYPEPLPGTTYRAELERCGVPVWTQPVGGRFDVGGLVGLARLVRREGVDVVHGHFEPSSHLAAAAARAAGRPVVLTRHYLAPNGPRSAHGVSTRVAGRLAARFLAVSDPVRDSLVGFGVPALAAVTLPLGVDRTVFRPASSTERDAARDRLGVGPDQTCVVATSHHRPGKGVDILIRAVAGRTGMVLALAGTGPLTPVLQELATELGADVRFLGRIDDVVGLLAAADVFCLPTVDYPEGLPMAVLEAMAMGRVVVATPVPALLPLLRDAGVIVPAGDPAALSSALQQLASDPRQRVAFGDVALARAAELDVRAMAESVLDVYEAVAGASR